VWAKKFTAERLKLENNVKNTKCLFYYLKIIQKFQILKKALKRAKTLKKQQKKPNFFQNHYWGGTVEELFAYTFEIYKKFGGNNPSILTPSDSVDVAT
jgi:hypothetical protein